ncbi:MAG: CDGSH iron-sulfur domain-containing protein [Candidatus Marsarchaeota archaeon]|nr:CDGSH iron-sulfur domain-containing protein [Candidatus Marsarchaeota archaeon]
MRVIGHKRDHPYAIKLGDLPGFKNLTTDQKVLDYQIHACACGLSKHKPFCDGSHKHAMGEDANKCYCYINGDKREEITDNNASQEIKKIPNEYE